MNLLILNATTKTIEAKLAGSVTTNQLDVTAHYADATATTPGFTEGSSDTVTNNTTAVTVVAAPAASTQRIIREITIYNADTVSATVTLQYNNNGTIRIIKKKTLTAGESWIFSEVEAGSSGAGLVDGDYGDVTVGGSGTTMTIDNDVVTFAKMQNITTDRLIGRDTASTGDPEELTVGGGIEFTGSGGIQTSALTGDVTKSAGGTATTIANDAVTYAKMQNVSATSRALGRKTAGAGNTEELTLSELLDFIGSAAQGDILYRDVSAWARLAAGTSGKFLKTLGAGANPAYEYVPKLFPMGIYVDLQPLSANPAFPYIATIGRSLTFTQADCTIFVNTTNDGSNYWTISLETLPGITVWSFNTASDTVATWTLHANLTISNPDVLSTDKLVFIRAAKTGAPGTCYLSFPLMWIRET